MLVLMNIAGGRPVPRRRAPAPSLVRVPRRYRSRCRPGWAAVRPRSGVAALFTCADLGLRVSPGRMDHASGTQRAADRGLRRVDRGQPGRSRSPSGRRRLTTPGDPMAADMCRAGNARPGRGLPEGDRAQRRCPGSPCRRRGEATRSLGDASGMASGGNQAAGASHAEDVGGQRSRPVKPSGRGSEATESSGDVFRKGRQRHPSPSEASRKGSRDNRVAT